MGDLPNRTSTNPNVPFQPVRSGDAGRMIGSQRIIGLRDSPNHPASIFTSHRKSLTPGSSFATTHAAWQDDHRTDLIHRESFDVNHKNPAQTNEYSKVLALHDPPPPGIYPDDRSAPRRPPMITEEAIKDYKEKTMGARMQSGRVKDIHRHLRVLHVIGNFVQEHNQLHYEDPYMQYRWYGDDKTAGRITTTLLAIIEDTAHAVIPHLYSRFTYNEAQRRDGASMESMVARIASHEMFDPLTQTLRTFGIRKLIQDKMATKKKTGDRQKKRESQSILQTEVASGAVDSLAPYSDEAAFVVPDLPLEVHPKFDTIQPLVSTELVNAQPSQALHQTGARAEGADLGAKGSRSEKAKIVCRVVADKKTQLANGNRIADNITNQPSTVRRKLGGKPRAKVKKNKSKRTASVSTAGPLTGNARQVPESERNVDCEENISYAVETYTGAQRTTARPSRHRKRKRLASDSSVSQDVFNSSESDDCEAELAELKKRMKELEKRKTKNKGKKRRSRQ